MPPRRNKTVQKSAPFRWTAQREKAAGLIAGDQLPDEQIATQVGVGRTTLNRWREAGEFRQRVVDLVEQQRVAVAAMTIADKQHRVQALEDRWLLMRRVIDERGADAEMSAVPGGTTGLLVRTFKMLGSGEGARIQEEYSVDTGLLREMRAHEEQAAKELGQWVEKGDLTSAGQPLAKAYFGVDVDRV